MPQRTAYLLSCISILAAVSKPVLAINKCVGADGRVVYQDAPCMAGSKQIDTGIANSPEAEAEPVSAPEERKGETSKVSLRHAYISKTIKRDGAYVSFAMHSAWLNKNKLPVRINYKIELLDSAKTVLKAYTYYLDVGAIARNESPRPFESFAVPKLGLGHKYAGGEFDHRRATRARVTYHLESDRSEQVLDNIRVVTEER
ncbi:MAG: DUF4124 domain-containing protein [Betaproteobacteria bacterium]|nr:DUF4124 domain-containing protein [Betaproteobacteria bacterium]